VVRERGIKKSHSIFFFLQPNSEEYPVSFVNGVIVPPFTQTQSESNTRLSMSGMQSSEVNAKRVVILVYETVRAFVSTPTLHAIDIRKPIPEFYGEIRHSRILTLILHRHLKSSLSS